MKKVRCHIAGKIQRSKRCPDLRRYWSSESCHLVCGLISYSDQERIKRAQIDMKMEKAYQEFKGFPRSTEGA